MEAKYHFLRGLITEFLNGETDFTTEEIMQKLDEAYDENEIDGREYDNLMCLF